LAVVPGGGEPGGDGGMLRLGTGGRVRSRMRERDAEYGDAGVELAGSGEAAGEGTEGPTIGPMANPIDEPFSSSWVTWTTGFGYRGSLDTSPFCP
jgi:hypothetical protein